MPAPDAPLSLSDLAQTYGLLDASKRQRLAAALRAAAQSGQPTSLARLLLAEGTGPEVLAAVLAAGEGAGSVRCDACGAARAQSELSERVEVPCTHCGSLLLGFRAFAKPPTRRHSSSTQRFAEVIPLPGEDANDATSPYGVVLPTPGAGANEAFDALVATDTTRAKRPDLARGAAAASPAGLEEIPEEEGSQLGGARSAEGFGFASQEELKALGSVEGEEEGGTTLDPDALRRLRAEAGLPADAPLAQIQAALSQQGGAAAGSGDPLDATVLTPPPRAEGVQVDPTLYAAPPGATPQPEGEAGGRSSIWPLCAMLILLLLISAMGIYALLQET